MSSPATLPVDVLARQSEQTISVAHLRTKDIALLERLYTFENPSEIAGFLLAHDELIPYLLEADKHIKRVFGESIVDVCLECVSDPEEDYEGLFVAVKTNLSPEESLDLLDKFDDEWFLDHVPPEVGSILTVGAEPV